MAQAFAGKLQMKCAYGAALFAAGMMVSALVGAQFAMSADYRGTQDQQQACTPDVMRLCSDSVPDVNRIVTCLRRNRSNLSPACGSVFGAASAIARAITEPGAGALSGVLDQTVRT